MAEVRKQTIKAGTLIKLRGNPCKLLCDAEVEASADLSQEIQFEAWGNALMEDVSRGDSSLATTSDERPGT